MASLKELLGVGDKRKRVIDDARGVLDAEVADKGGVGGFAIRAAYKLVQGVRPGFVRDVIDYLLDEFLDAIDPLYQEAITKGEAPGAYLRKNSARVADALLTVTDKRAEKAESGVLKKTYEKLRPTAKKHVEAAAPRLAEMLDRQVR
jgi:hypothetical protein